MKTKARRAEPAAPVYEVAARIDWWLKLILGGVITSTSILGIVVLLENVEAGVAVFAVTAFDALLFKAILPQRFQIYSDRLRIVLGGPLALNIRLSTIRDARPMSGLDAFGRWGIRFVTSTRNLVEIACDEGLDVVIAPTDRDSFLEQLYRAIVAAQSEPNAEEP